MPSLEDGLAMVLKHSPAPSRALETSAKLKLVVPNSAIGNLIGHGGQKLRQLCSSMNCHVNVSPRVESIKERLVTVSGTEECVLRAALKVCGDLQDDPNLSEHLVLEYDEKVPLGAWAGGSEEYSDTSVQLISLASASGCTKRELIENLRKAAPTEILVRHRLLGSTHRMIKGNSSAELVEILSEAWLAKGCDPAGARPPSGDDTAPKPRASSVPSGTRSTSARNGAILLPVRDVDLERALERDMLEEPKPPLSPLRCFTLESIPSSSDLALPSSVEDWDFGVAPELSWFSREQPIRTLSSHLALQSGTEDSDSSHVPELPCPTSSGGCSPRAGWGERLSRVAAHGPQAVLSTVSSLSSPASTAQREHAASTVTEQCMVVPRSWEAGPLQEGFMELYTDALASTFRFFHT